MGPIPDWALLVGAPMGQATRSSGVSGAAQLPGLQGTGTSDTWVNSVITLGVTLGKVYKNMLLGRWGCSISGVQ